MANTKVTSGVIKDDAVGADQLASNSVVTASIVDNAITTAKINNDAILTAKISDNAVTNAKLSSNSVDSDQYVDGSIDTAHIRDGQITSAKLDTNISVSGELTVGSHLNMGDGDILKMGASADLQIYHDGTNSYVKENGDGALVLQSAGPAIVLEKTDGTNMVLANTDGAVTLYYAGSEKIATTSSGVDVTGTVTADGLTVDTSTLVVDATNNRVGIGTTSPAKTLHLASGSSVIRLEDTDGGYGEVSGSNGNIRLRADEGNTQASSFMSFDIDSTEEMRLTSTGLGIGTSSPSTKLHLGGTAPLDSIIRQDSTTSGTNWEIGEREAGKWQIFEDDGDSIVATFMSSGNVGIGTTSPYHTFDVFGAVIANGKAKSNGLFFDTTSATTGTGGGIALGGYSNGTGGAIYHFGNIQGIKENSTAGNYASAMLFSTRANGATPTERMRIDSSGNLLVGKTSNTISAAGAKLGTGGSNFTRDNSEVVYVNRTTSDGSLITLAKDGSTVGSIGTSVGDLTIYSSASGHCGLRFTSGGVAPIDNTGSLVADSVDIGQSSWKFRDLYLSGQALVLSGGTTAPSFAFTNDPDTGMSRPTSDAINFCTAGAERVRINSTGQVGIACTDQSNLLTVDANSASSTTDSISVRNRGVSSGNHTTGLRFQFSSAVPSAIRSRLTNTSNGAGTLSFYTSTDGSAANLTERMTINSAGAVSIAGSLSKGSGSFKIDHPLESKADTHHLVHSFVEAPQADNIYRGKVDLVEGSATVNIDTVAGMTEGTFVALNTDVQCFTTNESDWDAVKGSVSGNILTISCQNTSSTATISWLVIGERQDQHMIDTDWTDENGKVIVEPLKIVEG